MLGQFLLDHEGYVDGWSMVLLPFFYGLFIGSLINQSKIPSAITSVLSGIIFVLIFLLSSFGMLLISSKVFQTDDYLALLSTPFSVFLILLIVARFSNLKNPLTIGIIMITLGAGSTYLGNYLINQNLSIPLLSIPVLWQLSTGIPLIISLHGNQLQSE